MAAERWAGDRGGRGHARLRLQAFDEPIPEGEPLGFVRIGRSRQVDAEGQHAARLEPGVDLADARVGLEQQAAADQQERRERELRAHQQPQRAPSARRGGAAGRGRRHRLAQVAAQGVQRRRPAEEHERESRGGEGEAHDAGVEPEDGPARDLLRERPHQRAQSRVAECQTERAAGEREEQVLHQQLDQQPPAARADGDPDRDLAAPGERTRQHQARDVGAGDNQQQPDGPGERPGARAEVAHQLLAQRDRVGRDDLLLVARVPDRLLRAQQVGLALCGRHAGLEPADPVAGVALAVVPELGRERHVAAHAAREVDAARHHADHGARDAVEPQRLAEHVALPAEAVLPEPVADDDDLRAFRTILLRREEAAEDRLHAEHGREVVGDLRALQPERVRAVRGVEAGALVVGDRLELALLTAPLVEVGVVDSHHVEVPARRTLVDVDEPLGLGERQRPQEEAVDQAEDGDVRRESEGEHRHHQRAGEPLAQQRAKRVTQVVSDHVRPPSLGSGFPRTTTRMPPIAQPGAREIEDGARPDGRREATALGPALEEQSLHLVGVRLAQLPRSEAQQRPVDAGRLVRAHAVSPRGRTRERAIFTSSASRRVSPRATACPARVMA